MSKALLQRLQQRPLPQWYQDAKFGIFIHWGLFAEPAFAPNLGNIADTFKQHYDTAVALTPYTEWYANAIKVPGTPSAEFHRQHYQDCDYRDFKQQFINGLEQWDASVWADAFAESGAKYVVLVTKHHDGFCLWPSEVENPQQKDWFSQRDIVGELAQAVRAKGLRFGLYYSGGIDWTFNPETLHTLGDFLGSVPAGKYPAYAKAQVQELVRRYQPSVLWNDISWPTGFDDLLDLFDDYYRAVPDGVVNDRWRHRDIFTKAMAYKPARKLFDWMAKRYIKNNPDAVQGVVPGEIPHSDFRTPEYTSFDEVQDKKWESTRGMSHSFGFNRNDTEQDYESAENLLSSFIDVVAKNGNLLLNVGPTITGEIPQAQLQRLRFFGQWLAVNGRAIYGTRPWQRPNGVTACDIPLCFTCTDTHVYIILMAGSQRTELVIKDFKVLGEVTLLADNSAVKTNIQGQDLHLSLTPTQAEPVSLGQVFELSMTIQQ